MPNLKMFGHRHKINIYEITVSTLLELNNNSHCSIDTEQLLSESDVLIILDWLDKLSNTASKYRLIDELAVTVLQPPFKEKFKELWQV